MATSCQLWLMSLTKQSHQESHMQELVFYRMVHGHLYFVLAEVPCLQGKVVLPPAVSEALQLSETINSTDIIGKKGPVFATAIIAGTMAVKKTSDLIPFCHPIPIEKCDIRLHLRPSTTLPSFEIIIDCIVQTSGKTGVEMEALVGVTNTAMCVYDMLKAVSQDIRVTDIELISKSGGKHDFDRCIHQ
jgi:cyclic pyranopterin monophosphate synthase